MLKIKTSQTDGTTSNIFRSTEEELYDPCISKNLKFSPNLTLSHKTLCFHIKSTKNSM